MFRKIRNLEKQMLDVQKDIEAFKKENKAFKLELFEVRNPAKYKRGDWVMVLNVGIARVIGVRVLSVPFGFGCSEFKRFYTVSIQEPFKIAEINDSHIIGITKGEPEGKSTTVTNYKPKVAKKPVYEPIYKPAKVGRPKGSIGKKK